MEEVKCIYKDSCTDNLCLTCANNKRKKSHYVPDLEPYTPYYPYYPAYPYFTPTTTPYPFPWLEVESTCKVD